MIRQDQSLLKHFGCDENDCSWLSRKQMEILVEFTPFAYKNGPYLAFGICELITWSIFFFSPTSDSRKSKNAEKFKSKWIGNWESTICTIVQS